MYVYFYWLLCGEEGVFESDSVKLYHSAYCFASLTFSYTSF